MKFPKPEHLSTKDNDRELFYMKATQFPIISTDATTGHKLQGCSVKDLFVLNWSLLQNWTYVMLSRVETKAGFFTGAKLSRNLSDYAVPTELVDMLNQFKQRQPSPMEEYDLDFLING